MKFSCDLIIENELKHLHTVLSLIEECILNYKNNLFFHTKFFYKINSNLKYYGFTYSYSN
jgi:hypothetical protein